MSFVNQSYSNVFIDLIGLGGTGGLLFNLLGMELNKQEYQNCYINLIDGDIISEKNLIRQSFLSETFINQLENSYLIKQDQYIIEDYIKYKVFNKYLISKLFKYSNRVGILINQFLDEEMYSSLLQDRKNENTLTICLNCVDNNKSRLDCYNALKKNLFHDYLFITAGNDLNKGTVYSAAYINGNHYPKYDYTNTFRTVELKESIDIDKHLEQNLSINNFMAGLIFSSFIGFYYNGRIDYISRFDDSNKKSGKYDICNKMLHFI